MPDYFVVSVSSIETESKSKSLTWDCDALTADAHVSAYVVLPTVVINSGSQELLIKGIDLLVFRSS